LAIGRLSSGGQQWREETVSEQETVRRGRLLGQLLRKWLHRDTAPGDFVALAENLRLRGDLSEAQAICAEGLENFPEYASAHVLMGDILRDQGLAEAAEAQWQEARRIHPEHPRANLRLAQVYLARGETARSMVALELSLLYSPGSHEANSLLRQAKADAPEPDTDVSRPAWLTPDRFDELLSEATACPSVAGAALIAANGNIVGGNLSDSEMPEEAPPIATMLLLESRHLMKRIGAGPLRAVLIRGVRHDLQCFEVDGFVLLVNLVPGTPVGLVRMEIQGTVAALRRRWEDNVRTGNALPSAA
jgi:predicted regulator of Ras-like GTPase activity (Roadblock/LC7/MglB family)